MTDDEPAVVVLLTVHEARALIRAADLMLDCFAHEVRSTLRLGPGETPLELAALRIESAIERQELPA